MLESGHPVVFARLRRQHDDRHVGCIGARPENAAHVQAADAREVEIQDDQIRRPIGDRLEGGVAGADDARIGVAVALESVLDEPGDVGFVFNDEDLWFRHGRAVSVPAARHAAMSKLLIVG